METIGEELRFDDVADVLASKHRRDLLLELLEHNPQPVPTVADTTIEDDTTDSLAIRHMHLPKLADYDLINWDTENHEITKGPNFDEIRPVLELLDDHSAALPADW